MTRFVIDPEAAIRLAAQRTVVPAEHQLVAPTLLRSQMLSLLYQAVQRGEIDKAEADERLNHFRKMRVRLLGDRVLQNVAWKVAAQLGWPDTLQAEYIALTQLQADALITLDPHLAAAAEGLVTLANVDVLS